MIDRIQSTGVFAPQNRPATVENNGTDVLPTEEQKQESEVTPKGIRSKEQVEEVVKGLNDFLTPTQTSLKFELHEKLNEYYVTLVDDKTQQVVREIPSKKMLDFYAAMTEFIGIMVDKKI